MKKLYIVVTKLSDKKKHFADYLGGELVDIKDFSIWISESVEVRLEGKDIDDNSLIYFRKVGDRNLPIVNIIANVLDKKGIDFIDKSLLKIGLGEDKLVNNYILSQNGISICPTAHSGSFAEISAHFGLPFLAKEVNTQRNEGIWIIKSQEDFNKVLSFEDKQFMFQKLMDIEKEFRLLVMGDKVATVLVKDKRIYEGEKLETPVGIPEEYLNPGDVNDKLKSIAVESAKALNLQIAGVDLMIEKGTGKAFIIEVNRGPGITLDPDKSPELPELKKYIGELIK